MLVDDLGELVLALVAVPAQLVFELEADPFGGGAGYVVGQLVRPNHLFLMPVCGDPSPGFGRVDGVCFNAVLGYPPPKLG
eukprot:5170770-Heterocapsa_arctica.AAC.1